MGNNEDEIKKFFEEKLKKSGYSLENKIEKDYPEFLRSKENRHI
jgi:hypothetical protein